MIIPKFGFLFLLIHCRYNIRSSLLSIPTLTPLWHHLGERSKSTIFSASRLYENEPIAGEKVNAQTYRDIPLNRSISSSENFEAHRLSSVCNSVKTLVSFLETLLIRNQLFDLKLVTNIYERNAWLNTCIRVTKAIATTDNVSLLTYLLTKLIHLYARHNCGPSLAVLNIFCVLIMTSNTTCPTCWSCRPIKKLQFYYCYKHVPIDDEV